MAEKGGRRPLDRDEEDFDRMVAEIQARITEEEERMYTERVRAEASAPYKMGRMEDPDATAAFTGTCGDTMVFQIKVRDDRLADVMFTTDGCGPTMACASMLVRMVLGKHLEEVRAISSLDLEEALGGLPDESKHCAVLAVSALGKALVVHDQKEAEAGGAGAADREERSS